MFALISMSNMFGNVIIISLRQAIIPDAMLGRVASAYRLVVLGALPLGALFGSAVAQKITLSAPFLAGGLSLVVVAFAMQPIVNNKTIKVARGFRGGLFVRRLLAGLTALLVIPEAVFAIPLAVGYRAGAMAVARFWFSARLCGITRPSISSSRTWSAMSRR